MLDDLFQTQNLRSAADLVARPGPAPKPPGPSFSIWSTITAAPRGITAGVAQSGAFLSDVLGAFGQADATTYTGDLLGNMPEQQRRETAQARQQLTTQGLDFSSEGGDLLRGVAQGYGPDPVTAHVAERLVFDFARFATKAVGYTVAGGSIVGPALTGFDEGMQAASDLKAAGVDINTRTAAGSVIGALSAVGVGLPMAGTTALGTAGLVAAGGPLSFMGQQAAVRKILQDADYSKLAEQYDPFDPVGLAVATLVPAAFGVHGLRVNKAAAAAKAAEDFRTGPIPSKETPTAAAAREAAHPSEEHVDAARTLLAVEERQRSNPGRADDPQAVQAHETALARAEEQMAAGERVSVADVAPVARDTKLTVPAFDNASGNFNPDLDPYWLKQAAKEINGERMSDADYYTAIAEYANSWRVDSLLKELGWERRGSSNVSSSTYFVKQVGIGEFDHQYGGYDEYKTYEVRVSDHSDRHPADSDIEQRFQLSFSGEKADWSDIDIPASLSNAEALDRLKSVLPNESSSPSSLGEFSARIAEAASLVKAEMEAQQNAPAPTPRQASEAAAKPQAPDAASPAGAEPAPRVTAITEGAGAPDAPARLVDDGAAARIAQIQADMPDLMVQLDGMDKPMPLADVLAAVKAEADELKLDGDLMQAAAECALMQGA